MDERTGRIRWYPPEEFVERSKAVASSVQDDAVLTGPEALHDSWTDLVERFDAIPAPAGVKTPKEHAVALLELAAEVEHALMVQYLYASYSLKTGGARQKLLTVAIQEMYHLISIQNVLIALTGPQGIYLTRGDRRLQSEFNPLPLDLAPVDELQLAKFIVAEMPADFEGDEALRLRVEALEAKAEAELGIDAKRVGAIYETLDMLFRQDSGSNGWHVGPGDFQDEALIRRFAADRVEWRATIDARLVKPVTNPTEALALLRAVAAQGEGLGDEHDSHFWEFLELLRQWDAGSLEVLPLPMTPFASRPPPSDSHHSTPIEKAYTTLWADLFDVRYELLLLDIHRALATPRDEPTRAAFVDVVFREMKSVVGETATYLTTLDLRDGPSSPRAAAPFGLASESVPPPDSDATETTIVLLELQEALLDRLKVAPEFEGDLTAELIVLEIESIDKRRPS